MSLVVHEAERFEPGEDELAAARAKAAAAAGPLVLQDRRRRVRRRAGRGAQVAVRDFPGENEVLLEMRTREGVRRLRFGTDYRVAPSPALRAEIDQLLGPRPLAA